MYIFVRLVGAYFAFIVYMTGFLFLFLSKKLQSSNSWHFQYFSKEMHDSEKLKSSRSIDLTKHGNTSTEMTAGF